LKNIADAIFFAQDVCAGAQTFPDVGKIKKGTAPAQCFSSK
jgi:hypothetical protein